MPVSTGAPKLGEMKGEYTLQVSAWRDKETADEMVKRLEEAGYPAFVEERPYKDGTWFTVRVGRYGSRKDAQLAVESFALELKSSYWIDRVKSR
jgi:septal ring-binding cell division protein DamX